MGEDFLLGTETAKALYAQVKELPIFDFHNHLSAEEIYRDREFHNLTEAWLQGDHYKWRAMRAMGISEEKITGGASDREKFNAWAETMPHLIGNPLYHWTHMELRRYFGCDLILNPENADAIWEQTEAVMGEGKISTRKLLAADKVMMAGTTDDPADDLFYHRKLREENMGVRVCPTFRPDRSLGIEKDDFADYMEKLGEAAGKKIDSFAELLEVLKERLVFFCETGCLASDHSLERWIYRKADVAQAEAVFQKKMRGETLSDGEIGSYRSVLLTELAKMYAEKGVVMQLHIGAVRNQSARMLRLFGADAGCDGIDDRICARELTELFSGLDAEDQLPKTVLFGLNPCMNEMLAVLAGSYCREGAPCKVQIAPAWWFCDNKKGMEDQLTCFANLSQLGGFIGMTTDSRSFLSFSRHEYFRRILCNWIGNLVENGEYPNEEKALWEIAGGICCYNAEKFFSRG